MSEYIALKLDDLCVWSDNPRHFTENLAETGVEESGIINILIEIVGENKMFNLICDIVKSGGLMGNIFPIIVQKNDKNLVYDGNRRISSLKLINNPDICESDSLKRKIKKLVDGIKDLSFVDTVMVYITNEEEALELMDKTHNGEMDGVGLIPWEAFQRDGSLVKRGQTAKYPLSYNISTILGYSKKSHFKIPYTDLNRLFGSKKIRDCFNIVDFTEQYKDNIEYAIQTLIKYKQFKHFKSFSRHFNITDTSIDDSPVNTFCEWVKEQEKNKNTIVFDSNSVEIFEGQNFDFSMLNFKMFDFQHKEISFASEDLYVKYFNPNGEEIENIDSKEVGIWNIEITYNGQSMTEKIEIKKLLNPKIDFTNADIRIPYGNTLNLREIMLRAINSYGQDVKSQVSISNIDSAEIVGDIFDSKNTIGKYSVQYAFENVNGEPFSVTKQIMVFDSAVPLKSAKTISSLISFNNDVSAINISPEVNELISEINSLDYSVYKGILVVVLRALLELTFDTLSLNSVITFTSNNDLEKKIEDFKQYLINGALSQICTAYNTELSSFHSELNTVQLINPTEISAYLNLAAHKGVQRIDSTKAIELCKSTISPILVYASLLLKRGNE